MSIWQPSEDSKGFEKKSTTTMTFRIDSDIIQLMREKAERDGVTLNTFVSHVLKRYTEWDMYIENRAGIIPLTRPVAFELFKRLSREEVINLAKDVGKKSVYDTVLFMRGDINQISFAYWFLSRMKNSSASVSLKNTNSGTRKAYIIKHDMGENWSLYHKTVLEAIFMDILKKPVQVSITESTLTWEFEVDDRSNTYGSGRRNIKNNF